ncbi:hypothetical protein HHL19_16020 [Streptomyces sp. R302]|uniref:hypothetical protein n=1 Tax=unclassified Streptomyces TaxID=2593676 RepID=UPI00145E3612|nr:MULTISPECIES: hypothetical protein [unclassified Streptomyces]NML51573.1 hypothetical protein [Streptomyces sp. R301]NML80151.1 hypothetical protein [Streptomyces sp. R302]
MQKSFTVHAGLQLALSAVALGASAYTAVPRLPSVPHEEVLLGIAFASLFPLHAATIFRSIALESRVRGYASSKTHQWRALKALPHRVHALLVVLFLAGGLLLSGLLSNDSGLQATHESRGRYFAVDTTDPLRPDIEVTRSRYEELSKQGQRSMFAIYGLIAAGGGAVTLVLGKLHGWAGRP